MCDANIFTEGVRKSKNQPFSIFFLKTADFYHAMVRKILAIDKEIDEILHLQAKIIIRYARKKWSSCVSRQRMTDYEFYFFSFYSFILPPRAARGSRKHSCWYSIPKNCHGRIGFYSLWYYWLWPTNSSPTYPHWSGNLNYRNENQQPESTCLHRFASKSFLY